MYKYVSKYVCIYVWDVSMGCKYGMGSTGSMEWEVWKVWNGKYVCLMYV